MKLPWVFTGAASIVVLILMMESMRVTGDEEFHVKFNLKILLVSSGNSFFYK